MKRVVLVLALLIALTEGCIALRPARAFEPPNDRYFGYFLYNRLFAQVRDTGEVTWRAVDDYGFPEWRDFVSRSLDAWSSDQDALGNQLQLSIREARPEEMPDVILYAETPGYVSGKCASEWATACVWITSARPIPAYFNAAAMSQWPYVSVATVGRHEVFHPLGWACDQYQGGCPPTDQLPVRCLGNPDSLMDCNGAARTVAEYDKVTFAVLFIPAPLNGVALRADLGAVFYGESGSNLVGLAACSRVAVFYQTMGFPVAFGGYGPCSATPGIYGGVAVPILPGTCYSAGAENAVPVTWGRSVTLAGCTP